MVTRTDTELEKAVRHVCYELQRMDQYVGVRVRARDRAVVAACFEGFYLHLRNGIEFLYSPRAGRISASDYLGPNRSAPKVKRLSRASTPINRHISHLMWERVTDPPPGSYASPEWDSAEFNRLARDAFYGFLNVLEGRNAEWAGRFRTRLAGDIDD